MGSTSDETHAKKITDNLDEYGISWEQHVASAHKQPLKVLEILETNKDGGNIVYITIAGRSNALSGFVAANSTFPTLGCPPFSDKADMLVTFIPLCKCPVIHLFLQWLTLVIVLWRSNEYLVFKIMGNTINICGNRGN